MEVDSRTASGGFDMPFLKRRITNAYDDVLNVVMRVSSANDTDKSGGLLLNAHIDSTLGSQGASDCAACVGASNFMFEKVKKT